MNAMTSDDQSFGLVDADRDDSSSSCSSEDSSIQGEDIIHSIDVSHSLPSEDFSAEKYFMDLLPLEFKRQTGIYFGRNHR